MFGMFSGVVSSGAAIFSRSRVRYSTGATPITSEKRWRKLEADIPASFAICGTLNPSGYRLFSCSTTRLIRNELSSPRPPCTRARRQIAVSARRNDATAALWNPGSSSSSSRRHSSSISMTFAISVSGRKRHGETAAGSPAAPKLRNSVWNPGSSSRSNRT